MIGCIYNFRIIHSSGNKSQLWKHEKISGSVGYKKWMNVYEYVWKKNKRIRYSSKNRRTVFLYFSWINTPQLESKVWRKTEIVKFVNILSSLWAANAGFKLKSCNRYLSEKIVTYRNIYVEKKRSYYFWYWLLQVKYKFSFEDLGVFGTK